MKKNSKNKSIVTYALFGIFIVILMLALFSTKKFIKNYDINTSVNNPEEKNKKIASVEKNAKQQGNTSGNLSINNGSFSFGPKYNYLVVQNKNLKDLKKYSKLEEDGKVIFSSNDIKYLNQFGNYLYFVTTHKNKEKIVKMDIENDDMMYIETSVSNNINSLTIDKNFIYYTVKQDPNIYRINEDDSIKKVYSDNNFKGNLKTIGINNGFLYFFNSTGAFKLDLNTQECFLVSANISSDIQSPILTNNGIVYFSNLRKDNVSFFDFKDNSNIIMNINNIKFYNYIDGFLFLSDGINVYETSNYIDFKKINEIKLENNPFYLSDKYLISVKDSVITTYKINWILTQ